MNNLDRIVTAIKDIEKYFKELGDIKKGESDLESPLNFHASSMLCLTLINRAIDIGEEILVNRAVSMPTRYRDVFKELAKEGVIDQKLQKSLEELADYRNFLSHEYFGLDKKKLVKIVREVYYIKDFVERVKKTLAKEANKK